MSADHRKSERLELEYPVAVAAAGTGARGQPSRVTNFSQGGLCFVTSQSYDRDQQITILLPSPHPIATLAARVVWCRPQRKDFSVGAEFTTVGLMRRTRLVEMHRAIQIYCRMKYEQGATPADQPRLAVEWFTQHGLDFLAGVPD